MSVIGLTAIHHFCILCHPLRDDNATELQVLNPYAEKNRIREISFLLMVLITNICFVIPSCSKPHILIHNFKSISKSDINTLHDSKYILRIVTNNDEKDSHDLLHYPKSDKLIRVDDYRDSYVFSVKNNQLEIISTHSFGFNSTALVFLLNFNQTDGIMMIRNTEWNIDYEDSAVPIIYGMEKCD